MHAEALSGSVVSLAGLDKATNEAEGAGLPCSPPGGATAAGGFPLRS